MRLLISTLRPLLPALSIPIPTYRGRNPQASAELTSKLASKQTREQANKQASKQGSNRGSNISKDFTWLSRLDTLHMRKAQGGYILDTLHVRKAQGGYIDTGRAWTHA